MKISVVVPVYNEARYITTFLDKLSQKTKNIIIVDDGSTDQTLKLIQHYPFTLLSHIANLGKGAALKTGCDYAFNQLGADAVVIMDGDDQHDPDDLKNFYAKLKSGSQIILGVRQRDKSMPLIRIIGNQLTSLLVKLLFGHYISDIPSGYKAFTRQAYKKLRWHSSGYDVEAEIAVRLLKNKLSYTEIPIKTIYHGKQTGFNLLDAARIIARIPYWIWS